MIDKDSKFGTLVLVDRKIELSKTEEIKFQCGSVVLKCTVETCKIPNIPRLGLEKLSEQCELEENNRYFSMNCSNWNPINPELLK